MSYSTESTNLLQSNFNIELDTMAAMADGYDSDEALETKIATGATEGAVGA